VISDNRHRVQRTRYRSMAEITSRGRGETMLEEGCMVNWVLECGERENEQGLAGASTVVHAAVTAESGGHT